MITAQNTTHHPRAVLAVWRRALWNNAHDLARSAAALYERNLVAPAGYMAITALEEVARGVVVVEAEMEHRTRRVGAPTLSEVQQRASGWRSLHLEAIMASFFIDRTGMGGVGLTASARWRQGRNLRRNRAALLSVGVKGGLTVPRGQCSAEDAYNLVCVAYEALAEQAVHCADDADEGPDRGAHMHAQVAAELKAFREAAGRTVAPGPA